MTDNSRSCFHGNVIFGSQGQMRLSSNKLSNGTGERGKLHLSGWEICCKTQQTTTFSPHFIRPSTENRPSVTFSSGRTVLLNLHVNFDVQCVSLLLSIVTFLITGDPGSVTRRHALWPTCTQRCLRVIPEAYGRKPMPIYYGSDQRLSSSFTWTDSLSGCLRRLGPGNWVPSNQLDSPTAACVSPHAGVNQDSLMRQPFHPGP